MRGDTRRAIRKCGKCKLNLRTHCGLFDNPRAMWHNHRKCPGYMKEEYYQEYLHRQERLAQMVSSKPSSLTRRQQAKIRHTERHHDGMHPVKPRV